MGPQARRLACVAAAALLGLAAGWVAGAVGHLNPLPADYPFLAQYAGLPHHVPEHPGGLSFRFATAHDVIHERFPRHGTAHYRERNRLTREHLAALSPDDPATFPLTDDLAAGLERLGRSDEVVVLMRDKLARQQAGGLAGLDLYTSYANLGTFLLHASFAGAVAGDPTAKEQFREGLGFVRKSVVVNPAAHFGRERWQAAIAEFLLAAMGEPELLRTFDCLGNRLDLGIEEILDREQNWVQTGYGRPTDATFSRGWAEEVPAFLSRRGPLDDPSLWAELSPIRRHVTKVGAERGWEEVAVPSHRTPVPFDEPVLGIIGMWRQGGGASPHFALALGETMLRVGQRYIAWAAYERAARLAARFWPDPALQEALRGHCHRRQAQIERTLTFQAPASARMPAWQHVSPPPPAETVAGLRQAFEAELAHGEGYQGAYQRYEEERIAAGISITEAGFYDAFHARRADIASRVGPEEWFVFVPRASLHEYAAARRLAWGVCGAGLLALATAVLTRQRARRPQQETSEGTPSSPGSGTAPAP
jgi:hypothetical protein